MNCEKVNDCSTFRSGRNGDRCSKFVNVSGEYYETITGDSSSHISSADISMIGMSSPRGFRIPESKYTYTRRLELYIIYGR
jgi:hypothetical protein